MLKVASRDEPHYEPHFNFKLNEIVELCNSTLSILINDAGLIKLTESFGQERQ